MKHLPGYITLFLILGFSAKAQIITTDPSVPTDDKSVIVYYDATKGSQGLKDYTGDVYAHTGVITDKSTSGSDWKYVVAAWNENIAKAKMTRVSANLYSLTLSPTIRDYYGVPAGEKILKLAFVFRNSDGSKEGKTASYGDIFADVFEQGLNISLQAPENRSLVVDLNEIIRVQASATRADSISIFLNGKWRKKSPDPALLTDSLPADSYGENMVKVAAYGLGSMVADSFFYFVRPPVTVEDLPTGIKTGINYKNDTTVILNLYAPDKQSVFAIGDFSDWIARGDNYMKKTQNGLNWWVEITHLIPGKEYVFQYLVDDSIRIGDPYAEKVSDPWNDKWISDSTYPGLIPYPEGKTSGIATVLQTAQSPYIWKNETFDPPATAGLVIYELLVRDFTVQHSYQSLIDTLGYLERLGVNAIELMPINEFEGNESWGYNPSYYFAPDKYYGPKNTLKAFIDSCHSRGIAVIQDMVLNHSMSQSPLAMLYWDPSAGDGGRPSAENPWYNQVSPNPVFSWGEDFNHESPQTQQFVDSVTHYWLSEYKIDGFRFDFTKGFTNTYGDGSAYDAYRIAILERMADALWKVNPNAYVILEHFADNSEEKVLADYGMMLWGNLNHDFSEAAMGYTSSLNWGSYLSRGWSRPHLITYMESHDEERLMYKNLQYGNSSGNYSIKQIPTALRRIELAGVFLLSIPGPKMIWQFEELGYDYSIDYNGRVGNKPVRWDYYQNPDRKRLYDLFSLIIALKKNQEAFNTVNFIMDVAGMQKRINLYHSSMDVVVLGNFDVSDGSIDPNFNRTGTWYEYFSGDSIEVTNKHNPINLRPGAYRLFTSRRLQMPDIVLGTNHLFSPKSKSYEVHIYPNPSSAGFNIELTTRATTEVLSEIFDLSGRKIKSLFDGSYKGYLNLYWNGDDDAGQALPKGIYLLRTQTDGQSRVDKLVKQ